MRKKISDLQPSKRATEFVKEVDKLPPAKRAKIVAFMEMLARDNLAVRAVSSGMRLDWKAVGERVAIVAEALDLPSAEVKAALRYKGKRAEPIVTFAQRYHQNLNWLLMGYVGDLCHALAFKGGWRPAWWDVRMEAVLSKTPAKKAQPKRKTR